jgi:hypothetical protein
LIQEAIDFVDLTLLVCIFTPFKNKFLS